MANIVDQLDKMNAVAETRASSFAAAMDAQASSLAALASSMNTLSSSVDAAAAASAAVAATQASAFAEVLAAVLRLSPSPPRTASSGSSVVGPELSLGALNTTSVSSVAAQEPLLPGAQSSVCAGSSNPTASSSAL